MLRSLLRAVLLAPLLLAGAGSFQGREFPDFNAKDALTGREFSLHDLRGKVVLIDFWATWCGPCVRELPSVKRLHSRYGKQGLEIVSISLDQDRKRFESFARQKGMSWYHVMEGGGWSTRLAQQYGVNSIPRMLVLDPDGMCIADGARGRRLDEVIEAGLRKVKQSERSGQQPGPDAAADSAALQPDLDALREQLAEIAAPLNEASGELREIDGQIAGLQHGAPASGAPAAQQWAALITRLHVVRQDLFMLGLVDDHNPVALPIDPPEAAPPDEPWSASRVAPMLDSARRSIRSMQEMLDAAGRERAALGAKAAEIERGASGKGGATRAIESRVEALRGETDALAERFGESWIDRVKVAQRLIAAAGKSMAAAEASISGLDQGLRSLARTADAAPRDAGRQALREAFNSVRKKLEEAAARAGTGQAVTLPSDPFEGRTLKDTQALAELKVQIRVATEAAAALRELLVAQRGRIKALAAEDESMRRQLAERLQSGTSLEDLEQRFSEISLRALALGDPG